MATADPLDQWRHGVAAVLRAESDDPGRRGAGIMCIAALDVLTHTPGLPDRPFGDALEGALDRLPLRDRMAVPYTFRRARSQNPAPSSCSPSVARSTPRPAPSHRSGSGHGPSSTGPPLPR
jgi:hypothetical protein